MKKVGSLLPCGTSPIRPIQPRATSNSLCRTNVLRRNFVSTQTIRLGNRIYPIPCFLLFHVVEFTDLIMKVGYLEAIQLLADKFNVNIAPKIQNVTRYVYPNVTMKRVPPVIQFNKVFVLTEASEKIDYEIDPKWSVMTKDAKYLSLCNNNTRTFSSTVAEMQKSATWAWSLLPDISSYTAYVVINSTVCPTNAQTGILTVVLAGEDEKILFTPIILNELFLFYQPYPSNSSINFISYSDSIQTSETFIQKLYNSSAKTCGLIKRYPRWANV